ncbi:hypothetical protein CVT91_09585 [Candidatus Atribacteria bacterium HGW-Atribacteria-1]|nr:MAG: hypothetical protein CVT91_09585 [Candidatus Atribacteria bacterium HGW-Atribacteria-1]
MKDKILELINEQQSPLFRIMSVFNENEPIKRQFSNNICAFHIGYGYVLSVAHNLRPEAQLFSSISEDNFQSDIISSCNATGQQLFNRCYTLNEQTNKRYINTQDQNDKKLLINTLKQINYDTRWVALCEKGICKPFLIIQFKNNHFYNDATITATFAPNNLFSEPNLGRYTFLVELELVQSYYAEDIALYKITNTNQKIIDKMPLANVSYEMTETGKSLYCIQSAPNSSLGRMVNEARIEGILDHHAIQSDRIGGNYILEGFRYLLKGYFRFGSSGAPYFIYDIESNSFKVNAIQSEAGPIQLSINNKLDGNFQYVNAIASPLKIIEERLMNIMDQTS